MVGEGVQLPAEVWATVLTYLAGPDLFRCEAVCRAWCRQALCCCRPAYCTVLAREVRQRLATGTAVRRGLRCARLQLTEATPHHILACSRHRGLSAIDVTVAPGIH